MGLRPPAREGARLMAEGGEGREGGDRRGEEGGTSDDAHCSSWAPVTNDWDEAVVLGDGDGDDVRGTAVGHEGMAAGKKKVWKGVSISKASVD